MAVVITGRGGSEPITSRSYRPSVFEIVLDEHGAASSAAPVDRLVERLFATDPEAFRATPFGHDPYNATRLTETIFNYVPFFAKLPRALDRMTACEVGCGVGVRAVPLSRLFKRYIGADINEYHVGIARDFQRRAGVDNLELVAVPADAMLAQLSQVFRSGPVDFIILFAVLEHMTHDERRAILTLCRDHLRGVGGLLAVFETPNRLIPFDAHSSGLHFFGMLPEEVGLEYAERSPRDDFRAAVTGASDRSLALRRFGLPLSFHEFELYLGGHDLHRRIVADGLDNNLIHLHLATNAELALDAYFRNNGVDVHRTFCRYWIEFVCAFDDEAHGAVRNLPFAEVAPVADGKTTTIANREQWALDRHAGVGGQVMRFAIDESGPLLRKAFLLFDLDQSAGAVELLIESGRGVTRIPFDFETARRARPERWHNVCSVGIESREAAITSVRVKGVDARTQWRCTNLLRA